jgi:hypothetical protein
MLWTGIGNCTDVHVTCKIRVQRNITSIAAIRELYGICGFDYLAFRIEPSAENS